MNLLTEKDAYEGYVPDGALIVGKKIKEVMEGFKKKIVIDHIHNGPADTDRNLIKILPEIVFTKIMHLRIFGDWEDICVFTEKWGLP